MNQDRPTEPRPQPPRFLGRGFAGLGAARGRRSRPDLCAAPDDRWRGVVKHDPTTGQGERVSSLPGRRPSHLETSTTSEAAAMHGSQCPSLHQAAADRAAQGRSSSLGPQFGSSRRAGGPRRSARSSRIGGVTDEVCVIRRCGASDQPRPRTPHEHRLDHQRAPENGLVALYGLGAEARLPGFVVLMCRGGAEEPDVARRQGRQGSCRASFQGQATGRRHGAYIQTRPASATRRSGLDRGVNRLNHAYDGAGTGDPHQRGAGRDGFQDADERPEYRPQ